MYEAADLGVMIKRSFWLAFDVSPLILWLFMLDCHLPNEDMFFHFCRQMVQICPHLCCFLSILKTTSNISSLASFYSSRENARSALEPACMLLSLFVLHQKLFKGGSCNFCRDAGEGDQAFVERVLEGTPSPKSHAFFPRCMWLK